jgi:hypothetical protein
MAMSQSSASHPADVTAVQLVPFGLPDAPPPHASRDVLAELHTEILPTSPAVKMGPHFLRDFYYGVLPEEGLVLGYVAYLDDAPIGFLATTADAYGFLATALRRRWTSLVGLLVRHPPSPQAVLKAMQVGGDRGRHRDEKVSEFLSLGVRPFSRPDGAPPLSRRQVAWMMMDAVRPHLPLPLTALVDETNTAARRMYDDMGWKVSDRFTAGWPVPQLVFRWDGDPSSD